MTKRIALYGGSFDPIHNGHIRVANIVRKRMHLDKIIFIPTGQTNFKSMRADKTDRFNMLSLAINRFAFFEICSFEIKNNNTSYTANTLEYIAKQNNLYDRNKIYFIIGVDCFFEIETWHDVEKIFCLCELIVVYRKTKKIFNTNYESALSSYKKYIENKFLCKIIVIKINFMNISSSEIRKRIYFSKSIKNLVPLEVKKYIIKNNLYKKI